jgi:nitrile hydratase accessory protein
MSAEFLSADSAAGPPRLNGELLFDAPWESRAFGLAAALRDRGIFDWDEFRVCLIAQIAGWEKQHAPDAVFSYYACWQRALVELLAQKGICSAHELEARERALAARPFGHDHTHGHEHDHDH